MTDFAWHEDKDAANRAKHGVGFELAQRVFFDPRHLIMADEGQSTEEPRLFCLSMVEGRVMTGRLTWREGRKAYEQENG